MKLSVDYKLLVAASAALALLGLGAGAAPAQRSAGAGTRTITPAQPGQAPAGVSTRTAAGAQNPPAPSAAQNAPATRKTTLADFAWLEGRWLGTWGPRSAEQCWSSPKAGVMVGTFRLVENEKTLVIEMFTLEEKPEGINFYFRHFTPDLIPWEKGDATVLNFVSLEGQRTTFENPVNGQPKHAIFVRVDPDTFVSRSEIVPESGDLQVIEITYRRQKPPATTAPKSKTSGGSAARP
jgi:hypothetical protein